MTVKHKHEDAAKLYQPEVPGLWLRKVASFDPIRDMISPSFLPPAGG